MSSGAGLPRRCASQRGSRRGDRRARRIALHPSAALGLLVGLGLPTPPVAAAPAASEPCPVALKSRPAGPATLALPRAGAPLAAAGRADDRSSLAALEGVPGYGAALRAPALGWPLLPRWCVWLEPLATPADPWQRRWLDAVEAALARWAALLPVVRVQDPAAAQVRVLRRRPPLASDATGRGRASHGRALLSLVNVQRRLGHWRLEPAVEVLIGPGQRAEALEATALHELGHAFGLWGHSPDPADALATAPGPVPVRWPTARDRATLRWLYAQPTPFGREVASPP